MTKNRICSIDKGWEDRARCKGLPSDWFYPPKGKTPLDNARVEIICTLCSTCPVRKECLNAGLLNHEEYGIWGGLTRIARNKLYRKAWVCALSEEGFYIETDQVDVLQDQEIINEAQSKILNNKRKSYTRNIITHQWVYKLEPKFKMARRIIDEHYFYETPETNVEQA